MDDKDERALMIINAEAEKTRPVPPLNKKRDGFSRQDVINSFARSFEMIGGVQRLALWANAHPDKFYPLYARLLPSAAINIGVQGQVVIQHALMPTELDVHPGEAPDFVEVEPNARSAE